MSAMVIILTVGCSPESSQKVKEDYTQIPFIGDYEGTLISSTGEESNLSAQVIAYEDGKYQVNLLSGFDSREPVIAVLQGQLNGKKVNLTGVSDDGSQWLATIEGSHFTGKQSSENKSGSFNLTHIFRLSPNLNKQAPDDAIVLFDGTNLDQWQHVPDAVGCINLSRQFGSKKGVVYLKSEIWSEKAASFVLELGSNDAIKVWLNEKELLSRYVLRGAAPAQEKVGIRLLEGWNSLLLKITNAGGSWGTFVRIVDENGKTTDSIFEKDESSPDGKSNKDLIAKEYYLTSFYLAGPYLEEGMKPEELFKNPFPPEKNPHAEIKWQKHIFRNVDYSAKWSLKKGFFEVFPGSGSLISKKQFSDFKLHLEFRSPFMPEEKEQGRGNSGVYLQGFYEVQVLDSYGLEGADNECGGIYKTARPLVNMCAPPMQWQSYDITFRAPRFNDKNKKMENARLTVNHNGTLIHDDIKIPNPTGGSIAADIRKSGGIMLQDHSDKVQYRNIWLIEK